MQVQRLAIPGVMLITTVKHGDDRGFFSEVYNSAALQREAGIDARFVQDNHSLSRGKGVVRGLHFQTPPKAQDKFVRVIRGTVLDVVVDLRHGSPTYAQHVAVELSAENWAQLWVPKGCAHGFCTLTETTEVLYKVTESYSPEHDKGMLWNDPALGIDWPTTAAEAIVSAKDQHQPLFAELPAYFQFDE